MPLKFSHLPLLVLALTLAACERPATQAQNGPPPPQVTVATPARMEVADKQEFVGRFVAIDAVEVRARVSGYLSEIHFRDGQMVEKGDLLFTIDRRPFEAALDQARANLEQARANLAFAESDLKRARNLERGTSITEQVFDQRVQARGSAEASVKSHEAAVRQATLDFEFTELRAPVSGRIGDRRVSTGNLVMGGTSGDTTLLATIQSTDPIRFEFTLDESSYLRYLRLNTKEARGAVVGVPVKLKLLDENKFGHEGRMDFVDNAIDGSSGVIRGRAEIPNPNGLFTPGMFGRVQIAVAPPVAALLVPDTAIGTEQVRKFVMVVDQSNVARQKYVTLGSLVDGLRVISDGLGPEDRVVINGLMRVRPGVAVTPQQGAIASAAPPPAADTKSN
jgi:RND family efflux transporter MFP subunit